jgi:hypothetical protein
VVETGHWRCPGRLVPNGRIDATAGQIRLRCTQAESGKLEPAEETQFIPPDRIAIAANPGAAVFFAQAVADSGSQTPRFVRKTAFIPNERDRLPQATSSLPRRHGVPARARSTASRLELVRVAW